MNAEAEAWEVRLTAAAEADFRDILQWTARQFGPAQAQVYAVTLSEAIAALSDGPGLPDARKRDDVSKGISTLHVARGGRRGRHFVMFRVRRERQQGRVVEVLRLLHDAMDFPRHLPGTMGDE